MTDVKLKPMTEDEAEALRKIALGGSLETFKTALRMHGYLEGPPVGPLLIAAREIASEAFEQRGLGDLASKTRSGTNDDSATVQATLAALHRGMELGREAARPLVLTRNDLYEAAVRANIAGLLSVSEIDRLHTALTQQMEGRDG